MKIEKDQTEGGIVEQTMLSFAFVSSDSCRYKMTTDNHALLNVIMI